MSSHELLVNRIPQRLQELDISQTELAKRLGCTRGYVSNIIKGRSVPSLDVLDRLADALELRPEQLISNTLKKRA